MKDNKPIFGGLVETHVKQPKNKKFINGMLPGWSFEDDYGFSELGKIWVVWHLSVKVVVISKSLQMVTCEVVWPDSQKVVVISVVYASNCAVARTGLWEELMDLSSSLILNGKPWLVLGDFNQVLHPSEHSRAVSRKVDKRTRAFRQCLLEVDLSDLNFRGNTFTWWNKNKTRPVAKKLDGILVNDLWIDSFPLAVASFGSPDFSDHASLTVVLNPQSQKHRKPFKFYNFLLQNADF